MVKYFRQYKIILTLILILVLMTVFVTACNLINLGGGEPETGPTTSAILTPAENSKVLLRGPVQIQSTHPGDNVARVELLVTGPDSQAETLIRADIPTNGVVLQQWIPEQAGTYTIRVRSYDTNNVLIAEQTRTIEVTPETAISLAPVTVAEVPGSTGATQPTVIPLTPLPISPGAGASGLDVPVIQVLATSTAAPAPTPTPFYPPPPPAPGVPPGPIQNPGLNVHPPVCDDAKYLGPYLADTGRRVVIPDPDEIAAPVVGGATVFRAWRLQNVGTCTWGPGYELAFYGGRSMGSGGAAFDTPFPPNPPRRNVLLDPNRLIVPEGKPNQVAVIELALVAPVTPGIHQSYWRMRNPHGVFFGPIIGVTMKVVRDCAFSFRGAPLYGAPVINRFEILGYGSVFHPTNPVEITAEVGTPIILDYDIINTTNLDFVFEEPGRDFRKESSADQSGRLQAFTPQRLGDYIITAYADNGPCTAQAQVIIHVIPRTGEQFQLDIILATGAQVSTTDPHVKFSPSVAPGTAVLTFTNYIDSRTNVEGHLQKWQRGPGSTTCYLGVLCNTSRPWQPVTRGLSTEIGNAATGSATLGSTLPTEIQSAEGVINSALGCGDVTSSDVEIAYSFCATAQVTEGSAGSGVSNSPWFVCGLNKDVSQRPDPPAGCGSVAGSSSAGVSSLGIASQFATSQSCTLKLFDRDIDVPLACGDIPIVAGAGLVLLIAVGWFFFK